MPSRIQDHGEWGEDRREQHPPDCACYFCNESRRKQWMSNLNANTDSSWQTPVGRPTEWVRSSAASRERTAPPTPDTFRRPGSENTPPRRSQPQKKGAFKQSRSVAVTTLGYALVLHAAVLLMLVVYTMIQDGAAGIPPMLSNAGDAYIGAWESGFEAMRRRTTGG